MVEFNDDMFRPIVGARLIKQEADALKRQESKVVKKQTPKVADVKDNAQQGVCTSGADKKE